MQATARAGANIAFVKYWGQADAALSLPLNNSISMTLDNAYTVTAVAFDRDLEGDLLSLNGRNATGPMLERVTEQLDRLRELAGVRIAARVESRNSFPTGAGIASSASGFAALTAAASAALGLRLPPEELSRLSRLPSGSACRSIFGGYVEWLAGTRHEDSYARQIAPEDHWPLRDIIAVVSREAKAVSSEAGHRLAANSPFLAARLAALDDTLARCRAAILERDLSTLGEVIEAEALSMHAVMMTSRPSAWYWSPGTVALIEAVRAWRAQGVPAYFTIDAGPNVHIITLPEWERQVSERLAEMPEVLETIVCGPGPGVQIMTGPTSPSAS